MHKVSGKSLIIYIVLSYLFIYLSLLTSRTGGLPEGVLELDVLYSASFSDTG